MSRLSPGQVLGDRFEIIGPLGRGGTATVWLVQDRIRGEQVALKVLHEHLTHDPSMRRRLRQEVQATARLDAKGALVCHDLHEVDGLLAVSMPYHTGRTLTEVVASDGPLDAASLRALGVNVGGALSQAHQRGVLHRDVTPNNLMVEQGVAVLTDFGLATTHDGGTRTATSVMGTPGYAAPEVWHGARRDPRSDLYGLGATLYYAATGEAPFSGQSPGQTLAAQLSGRTPSLADVRPDLPADLVKTISSLLEPKPDQRLQSASEVVEALETRIATEAGPEAVPPSTEPKGATALKKGPWTVVLRARRRGRQLGWRQLSRLGRPGPSEQAQRLTADMARFVGVSAEDVQPPAALSARKARLVKGVDRETAQRLDELAEAAGFRVKLYNEGPETLLERAASFFWLPIPMIWIFFAFSGALGFPQAMLLPACIVATILLSVVATPLRRQRVQGDVPLAFARDLGLALPETPADDLSIPAALTVETEPLVSDAPSIAMPALSALNALDRAIEESDDLPDIARMDLRSTARALRERLHELSSEASKLEDGLGTPAADLSWAAQRLERLHTLERAGQTVSEEEKQTLVDALESHAVAQEQAAGLESRLTILRAAVLEIAATARRARQSLLQSAGQADTARLLAERLVRQADAAERARTEARALGRTLA